MKPYARLVLLTLAGALSAAAAERLTYVDLVRRLTDLERLALLPDARRTLRAMVQLRPRQPVRRGHAASTSPGTPTATATAIIRKEGDQFVFAEMEGPGCIWRIWSAAPKEGHVRIYLDGATEPAVDLPFIGYFDGKHAPFTRSALVHTVAMGWNNYTPIPYQKSCKIVADKDWGAYYQFVYTTFPKGTQVPTFKRELTAEENAALDEANTLLTECGPRAARQVQARQAGKTARLRPAAVTCVIETARPGAITVPAGARSTRRSRRGRPRRAARMDSADPLGRRDSSPASGRRSAISSAPPPGANAYRSLPCGLTEDGWFYSHWFMPFAQGAEVDAGQRRPATRTR